MSKKHHDGGRLGVGLSFGIVFGLLLGLGPTIAHATGSRAGGEIQWEDVVVLRGEQLSGFQGAAISSLNLLALRGGKLEAIPFQVDEVRDGNHVFAWVSPLGQEQGFYDHDLDAGKLDADDELVFMAWDLGDRIGAQLPASRALELALTDPATGRTGYAYLVIGASLARSERDYVHLTIAGDRYVIDALRYHYCSPHDRGFFDELELRTDQGFTPNLVLRNRTPGRAELRGIGLGADFDFYDLIRGQYIAFTDGPVRVLWRCSGGADFNGITIHAKGSCEQVYYANRFDLPGALDVPFDFDTVLQSFAVSATFVINPQALPLTYYDPSLPQGLRIDGREPPGSAPHFGALSRDWCAMNAPGATLFFLDLFPPEWLPHLDRVSYIEDTSDRVEVGTYLGDFVHLLTKGPKLCAARFYALPADFHWGDQSRIPEIAHRQLQTTVIAVP